MEEVVAIRRPAVAQSPRKVPTSVAVTGFSVLGLAVFLWLSSARAAGEDQTGGLPLLARVTQTDEAPPPALPKAQDADAPTGGFFVPKSGPVTLVPTPAPPPVSTPSPYLASPPASAPAVPSEDGMRERMRAPALVIDLAQSLPPETSSQNSQVTTSSDSVESRDTAPSSSGGIAVPQTTTVLPGSAGGATGLNDSESFASRVGKEEVEVAVATQLGGLNRLVPQGAVIGAVMETALNSDLPGYARAIVAREVRSFDGSAILIPAGSRVIGQYKSGVAQGASRVFVVWTRLIRPDGVSIELASPATDELGRAGISGKVNTHFLARFRDAILTSVLSAGVSAAGASLSRGSTIIVASSSEASSLASQAGRSRDIPPTITTRQGANVRIFVARDLDFSRVGPAS